MQKPKQNPETGKHEEAGGRSKFYNDEKLLPSFNEFHKKHAAEFREAPIEDLFYCLSHQDKSKVNRQIVKMT